MKKSFLFKNFLTIILASSSIIFIFLVKIIVQRQ